MQERLSIGTTVLQSVSKNSRSDYTLYAIEDRVGDTCVLIIEAKFKMTGHSIAQAIGYFLAMPMTENFPALVLVVDKDSIQVLIFPFIHVEPLVNCVVLGPIPVMINNRLNLALIEFILRLSGKDCTIKVSHESIANFAPIPKRRVCNISTTTEEAARYKSLYRAEYYKWRLSDTENTEIKAKHKAATEAHRKTCASHLKQIDKLQKRLDKKPTTHTRRK